PADAHVEALGVLSKNDEVHVRGLPGLERTQPFVEQLDGPVVHVQVELEACPEQDVPCVYVVRHSRIAERADEDRVEVLAKRPVSVGGKRLAGPQIVLGAPRQDVEVELAAENIADTAQYLDGLGRHFDADAVAGDDGYSHRSIASAMPMPPLMHNVA